MRNRNADLARSDAILDGEAAAVRDLANCSDASDIAWYRGVAYANLANGSRRERDYFAGYDHAMALSS